MRWLRGTFLLYVAVVLFITMTPQSAKVSQPWWTDAVLDALAFVGIRTTWVPVEAAANWVMFLPFGVLGALLVAHARPGWRLASLVLVVTVGGFAFSAVIETVQLAIPGRVSTLQDVVLNGTGALAGALVAVAALAWATRRRAT